MLAHVHLRHYFWFGVAVIGFIYLMCLCLISPLCYSTTSHPYAARLVSTHMECTANSQWRADALLHQLVQHLFAMHIHSVAEARLVLSPVAQLLKKK